MTRYTECALMPLTARTAPARRHARLACAAKIPI